MQGYDGPPGHEAPIMGGWRGAFGFWTGDLLEMLEVHGNEKNYLCKFLCDRCLGCTHIPEGNAFNFSDDIFWRKLPISHSHYLLTAAHISPWSCVPGWSIWHNLYDTLHLLWLGFAKDIAGQLLYDEAAAKVASGSCASMDLALAALYAECREERHEDSSYTLKGECGHSILLGCVGLLMSDRELSDDSHENYFTALGFVCLVDQPCQCGQVECHGVP